MAGEASAGPRYGKGQSLSEKLRSKLQERGLWYVIRRGVFWSWKRLRDAVEAMLAPLQIRLTRRGTFTYRGQELQLYHHLHNYTWKNERAVEIAIATPELKRAQDQDESVLEVGRVLPHYVPNANWTVIDLVEAGPNVINADIVDFETTERFDLILSISTLEHVGMDDGSKDESRVADAHARIRALLKPGGKAVVTYANGYNKYLDQLLLQPSAILDDLSVLVRTGRLGWSESTNPSAAIAEAVYGSPYRGGNVVTIGYLR